MAKAPAEMARPFVMGLLGVALGMAKSYACAVASGDAESPPGGHVMRVLVPVLALLCVAGAEASTLASLDSVESAVILALELSPELLPPPDLVAALRADLTAINAYDDFFAQFRAVPNAVPGYILVRLTDSAWSEYLAGQYHGLDALNQQYGPVHIVVRSFIKTLSLDFDQPYNPPALASLYAGATGVQYVSQNHLYGEPSMDIASTTLGRYVYTLGWDDCPSGCLNHQYWEFQVTGGAATLLRSWGNPVTTRPTSWGRLKAGYR